MPRPFTRKRRLLHFGMLVLPAQGLRAQAGCACVITRLTTARHVLKKRAAFTRIGMTKVAGKVMRAASGVGFIDFSHTLRGVRLLAHYPGGNGGPAGGRPV